MKINTLLVGFVSVLALSACDNDNNVDFNNPVEEDFKLQVVHASQDSPNVNVLVNGNTAVTDAPYKTASSRLDLDADTYTIEVDGITPDGDVTVIGPTDIDFMEDQIYTIIAANVTASIEPIIITQPDVAPPSGQVTINAIHAASNAPTVDIYLTAPDADISSATPTVTLAYTDSLGPTDVASGDYQIRITPTGSKDVVYNSGTVNLEAGSVINLAAITNTTGTGDNPVNLLAIDDDGAMELLDVNTPTNFRVFHLSPDAPNVDVVINDNFGAPAVVDLAYPDFTDYLSVPADTYNAKVVPTGSTSPAVINADLELNPAVSYSVLAVNTLDNIEPLVLEDNRRAISTEAQLRIVHGSPAAGPVDLYLVAPGTDIATVEPNFSNVAFKSETGYISVADGDYDVIVTPAGSKTAAIGPAPISLSNAGIYTIIARDNAGGGAPLGVVLADDFDTL